MSVHIAIPHLHLPHPDWRRIRRYADTAAVVASGSGWVCAAVTVVGLGYGPHLAVLLSVAALLYVGHAVGAHRANAFWSARHRRVLEAFQRAQTAERQEIARRFAELSAYAEADRDPHRSRKDRYLNPRTHPGVGNLSKGNR